MIKISETVTEQRRRRKPRWWQRLVEDCKRIITEEQLDIIRRKHELGTRILQDEEHYRGWKQKGSGQYVKDLAIELNVHWTTLYQAMSFAGKFSDLEMFIINYKQPLSENFNWTYIRDHLLYEPRETPEIVTETIEQAEPVPTMEETDTRLRSTVILDVVRAFEIEEERNLVIQALTEHKLTRRENANDLIQKTLSWKRGKEVTTFLGRPLPSDMPFVDAVRQIAGYLRETRVWILFKGEVLEELKEGYDFLSTATSEFREFVRQCSIHGLRTMIEEHRIPRANLRSGDSDEGERQD